MRSIIAVMGSTVAVIARPHWMPSNITWQSQNIMPKYITVIREIRRSRCNFVNSTFQYIATHCLLKCWDAYKGDKIFRHTSSTSSDFSNDDKQNTNDGRMKFTNRMAMSVCIVANSSETCRPASSKVGGLHDFRRTLRCKLDLMSSGILRTVVWCFVTDVSREPIGPIFKG